MVNDAAAVAAQGMNQVDASATAGIAGKREPRPIRFTVVRETAATFDVIARMHRKHAVMALMIPQAGYIEAGRILGVITREQIADSVASSIGLYPR